LAVDDRILERFGPASGIVFVLLFVAGLFFGSPPDFGAPAEEVSRYYVEDQKAIQTTVVLFTVGLFFFLWFLASVRGVLRAAEGDTGRLSAVVFGGGLVTVATFIVTLTFVAGAAFRPAETPPEITRTLDDLSFLAFAPGACGVVAFFAATAALTLRTKVLPAWLGWLAVVPAISNAFSVGAVFTDSGPFSGDGIFSYLGFFSFLVWILGASIVLVRSAGARPAAEIGATGGGRAGATSTTTSS
jgi:hypothetical protein